MVLKYRHFKVLPFFQVKSNKMCIGCSIKMSINECVHSVTLLICLLCGLKDHKTDYLVAKCNEWYKVIKPGVNFIIKV